LPFYLSILACNVMELKFILESVLFSAQKALTPKELKDVLASAAEQEGEHEAKAFKKVKEADLIAALETLAHEHETAGRSYRLACVAGSWQFVTQPEYAPWLKALVGHKVRPPRLSQPALETLAIIAYRQPLTRAEIEQVRGVAVDGVMQTLLERGLVEQVGRAEVVGRPMTYGTTSAFLEYFGLRSLEDLPAADELRKIVVQKPDALVTADPGLATVPPEQLALPAEEKKPATETPEAGGESKPD
jgi:segregation and condensation protein B